MNEDKISYFILSIVSYCRHIVAQHSRTYWVVHPNVYNNLSGL